MEQFYSHDGETTFINNIVAFRGIDAARLKIVRMREVQLSWIQLSKKMPTKIALIVAKPIAPLMISNNL